jgi:hypothetical protein
MKFLSVLFLLISVQTFANTGPVAEVVRVKGKVFFDGIILKLGDVIKTKGLLKSERRSFAQVAVSKWNNKITIGPNSEMEFDFTKDATKKYTFINGRCRWRTDPGKKGKGRLYTKVASMGVRGTDYTVIANKTLGETEIVVLDGSVEFENLLGEGDKAIINKGQWGGIGGRFGDKIGKVLDLPKAALDTFNKQLNFQ